MRDYFQVKDYRRSTLRRLIKQALKDHKNGCLRIPIRGPKSVTYMFGRLCMKPLNMLKKRTLTKNTAKRMKGLLQILLDLNKNKKFLSKRGVFYKNKQLFGSQRVSDELLDDACCLLGATRRSLRVKAPPNGFVIGSLVIRERNGNVINFQQHDLLGKPISPYMFDFDIMSCGAKFILVVEKETTYASLVEDGFHKKVGCVIITGRGMPDVATRHFLHSLTKKLKRLNNPLPVLGLMDCDPYGIRIMMTYMCGSESLSFDSKHLATPNIKWLGLRPSDLKRYGFDSDSTKLRENDVNFFERLATKDFFIDKSAWLKEINKMLRLKKTCDLGAMTSKMVLQKVAEKDWLPAFGVVGT